MKRHVALTLLIVTTLGAVDAHIDLSEIDGRRFVATQGRLYDPLGWLEDQVNAISRSCGAVQRVGLEDPGAQLALTRIRAYSPPQSQSAQIAGIWTLGTWSLAEVEFETLLPAVVTLQMTDSEQQIVPRGIWSGHTKPWLAAPLIRTYLKTQVPEIPNQLIHCFDPRSKSFN